jgi:hypothetical protein
VLQHIYRIYSIEAATAYYKRIYDVDFNKTPAPPHTPFIRPPEVSYRSPIADDYFLGCGLDEVPACRALFRYRNFVIEFYMDIDAGRGDGLNIIEVEPVLRAMDARASEVLGIPLPKATP